MCITSAKGTVAPAANAQTLPPPGPKALPGLAPLPAAGTDQAPPAAPADGEKGSPDQATKAWLKIFGPDIPDPPSGVWVNLGCTENPEDAVASSPWNPPPLRQSPTPERPTKRRRVEVPSVDDDKHEDDEDGDEDGDDDEDGSDEPEESDEDAPEEDPNEDVDSLGSKDAGDEVDGGNEEANDESADDSDA